MSKAKNAESAVPAKVRPTKAVHGTPRDKVFATVRLFDADSVTDEGVRDLIQEGVVIPPRARLDLASFLAAPRLNLPEGHSLSRLIAEERNEQL